MGIEPGNGAIQFEQLLFARFQKLDAEPDAPQQRAPSAENSGMGDMLAFDAERLRILVERHLLHTGSARAREILDNWDAAIANFIKVMPTDYARALVDLKATKHATVAAE